MAEPTENPQIDPAPVPDSHDSMLYGFGAGCLIQLAFLFLGLLGAVTINSHNSATETEFYFAGWGLTQWIGIVPLILRQRQKGRRRFIQGLILVGCLGLLLSSACASFVLSK